MYRTAESDQRLSRHFVPGPERSREFRDALGRFATGITVVTTMTEHGPQAITANSFASVSLDPPIVLWSIGRKSKRFAAFAECSHFAIHVLGAGQRDLSQRFARSGQGFDGLAYELGEGGVPLLEGCLSRFECRRLSGHEGGDHLIMLGAVTAASIGDGDPLLFFGGGYGRLADASGAA
jgi:flavin reductase (DIM6/NTAB) family NADH-FMN oxidoreductase RutF